MSARRRRPPREPERDVPDEVLDRIFRHAESGRRIREEMDRMVEERIARGEPLPSPPAFDWDMAAGAPRWKTRADVVAALREALAELYGKTPGVMAVETRLKAAYAKASEFERHGRTWHAWILRCHAHRVERRRKRE